MSLSPPSPDPTLPPPVANLPPDSLGSRVLKGASWIVLQTLLAQILAFISKVIVFRQLSNSAIATATFAMSACAFLAWVQPALVEVLVQRQRHFKQLATPAFWLTAGSAFVAIVAGMVLGPLLAYANRGKFPPVEVAIEVLLTTLSMGFVTLTTVFGSELTIRFRFRTLAAIGTVGSIFTAIITIAMAFLGMGSWTMVIPATAANLLILTLLVRSHCFRPKPLRTVQPKRTGYLLRRAFLLTGAIFFSGLCLQADNYFVGLFQPAPALAAYALAYSMSFQFVQLASRGIRGTFLAAFATMTDDSGRPKAAYLEALRLVALASMPASILPIPAAHVAVRLVFSEKRLPAVPLFQIFLLGMGFAIVSNIAQTVWQARGWFRLFFVANAVYGVSFCLIVGFTAACLSVESVAAVVTTLYVLSSLAFAIIAAAPSAFSLKCRIIWAGVLPFLLSCGAAAAGIGAAYLAHLDLHQLPGAALSFLVSIVVYLVAIRVFMPATVHNALMRLQHALASRRHKADAGGTPS